MCKTGDLRLFCGDFTSKNGSESPKWTNLLVRAKKQATFRLFFRWLYMKQQPLLTKIIAIFTIFNEESLCNNRIYLAKGL